MTRGKPSYPAAYVSDGARRDVFDPALKHYPYGLVKGPPRDRELAHEVETARAPLLRRAVLAISHSVRDLVVLRGSVALAAWFPGRARRPHDIDLVVRDPSCEPGDRRARDLVSALREEVRLALEAADIELHGDQITLDEIWTYERAEGRRLSFPWTLPSKHGAPFRDVVQIDLVFSEPLQDEPTLEPIGIDPRVASRETGYRDPLPGRSLWFASRSESLAWKLLWLQSDMHPQGKDLYDAVLLAEDSPLSLELARAVFNAKGERWRDLELQLPAATWSGQLEWDSFALEYPELAGPGAEALIARLEAQLRWV